MSLTSGVKLIFIFLNVVVRFILFLISATLIFRGTDISKCFRESLGIRDNESRLYFHYSLQPYNGSLYMHSTVASSVINEHLMVTKSRQECGCQWCKLIVYFSPLSFVSKEQFFSQTLFTNIRQTETLEHLYYGLILILRATNVYLQAWLAI